MYKVDDVKRTNIEYMHVVIQQSTVVV